MWGGSYVKHNQPSWVQGIPLGSRAGDLNASASVPVHTVRLTQSVYGFTQTGGTLSDDTTN